MSRAVRRRLLAGGGSAEGEVLRKITEDTELAGRKVRASKDDPQYLVRSDDSGGEAVPKAETSATRHGGTR
jgi:Hypervirulence associated proteins TUDOR domain